MKLSVRQGSLDVVRYLLAFSMIIYAIPKILGVQCVVYPFYAWRLPLEQLGSGQLTWAFLGHSLWFQILLGYFELVPSIFLFFRRTALLGAILMLPSTLGVFLVNQAMHLWIETRWLSGILLVLNCLMFVLEWQRIKKILSLLTLPGLKPKIWMTVVNVVVLVAVVVFLFTHASPKTSDKNMFTGDWRNGHPYEWLVSSEQVNDSTVPLNGVSIYFQPESRIYETKGDQKMGDIQYTLSETRKSLEIYSQGRSTIEGRLTYKSVNDSVVQLTRLSDDHVFTLMRRTLNNYH